MDGELISRSALLDQLSKYFFLHDGDDFMEVMRKVANATAVDAVVMPEGKPGDYLEWDNGMGYRQIYAINSIMISEDCMRYELADFAPVVDHKNIVRIMSRDEAERTAKKRWSDEEWHEICHHERREENAAD